MAAATALSFNLVGAFKGLSFGSSSSSSFFKGDFGSIPTARKISTSLPMRMPLTIQNAHKKGWVLRFMATRWPSLVQSLFDNAEQRYVSFDYFQLLCDYVKSIWLLLVELSPKS